MYQQRSKSREESRPSSDGTMKTQKEGSTDLTVRAPPLSILKQGKGLEQAFPTWKEDLCKHVYHLKDLREAIKELKEPNFAELVIKESSEASADSDTALEKFVTAVGGAAASLSTKQKESFLVEEATRLRSLALVRKAKYEENKRILTGTLFHGPFISQEIKIKLKNEMGIYDPISSKSAESSPSKISSFEKLDAATGSSSYYDTCIEKGDLITLLKSLEKSCRHLDGSIDALELKSRFYAWEPRKDSTLQQAFNDYEQLNSDLVHCKVLISEEERVAKLMLILSKLTDLTPLLIDIRDKIERNIGPSSVAELMATVTQYVKHLNLIFRKIDETPSKGSQQFANISKNQNASANKKNSQAKDTNNVKSTLTCNKCGKKGHIAKECRSKKSVDPKPAEEKSQKETTEVFPKFSKEKAATKKTAKAAVADDEDIFEDFLAFAISVGNDI